LSNHIEILRTKMAINSGQTKNGFKNLANHSNNVEIQIQTGEIAQILDNKINYQDKKIDDVNQYIYLDSFDEDEVFFSDIV
jgi:hypothetical protein